MSVPPDGSTAPVGGGDLLAWSIGSRLALLCQALPRVSAEVVALAAFVDDMASADYKGRRLNRLLMAAPAASVICGDFERAKELLETVRGLVDASNTSNAPNEEPTVAWELRGGAEALLDAVVTAVNGGNSKSGQAGGLDRRLSGSTSPPCSSARGGAGSGADRCRIPLDKEDKAELYSILGVRQTTNTCGCKAFFGGKGPWK